MTRVAIIGGGLSGICVGTMLKRAGFGDFTILEGAAEFGGTWRDNTYPGCACDIPSVLYSFSFAQNPGWSRYFAPQPEIQRYVKQVAQQEGLHDHARFNTRVSAAAWNDDSSTWRLQTTTGPVEAEVLVAAAGPWHEPIIPDLPGLGEFTGTVFHSSRWDHSHDLRGKRVAVIGTGASAVQFVPEIAGQVEHLTVFQRTPHWVLPKVDRGVSPAERLVLKLLPGARAVSREAVFELFELLNAAMHHPRVMRQLERAGHVNIRQTVRDPQLRKALTPDYPLGCKRLLMSNEWYPALIRPNVSVVASSVESVGPGCVTDREGTVHGVDTIILATGFHITDMPIGELVHGRDGSSLAQVWKGSPRGYLGTTVAGFPNAFVMLGPNAGINTSATVLMEYQARYIVDAVRTLGERGLSALSVRQQVQDAFNDDVDRRLAGTVWNAGTCHSYFLDETGRNSFNYPGTARDLGRRLSRFDLSDYDVVAGPHSRASSESLIAK